MELILWRHAEAEDGSNDLMRELTERGQDQAKTMTKWLKPRLPKNYTVWVSQAARSQQTAMALSKQYTIQPQINPDSSHEAVLQLLYETHWQENLILVGHQPWLGRVCAQLLNGRAADLSTNYWSVKKGAVWWLDIKADETAMMARVKAVMPPALLLPKSKH
ncbi:MAG: histidine phosphatase family protein [Neisseria sp.]|nr:histidine phosphatase family protein [Neisseria sp.]